MRKALLALTLMVGVFITLGASAAPALAGNCTASDGIYRDGTNVYATAHLECDKYVDTVQFHSWSPQAQNWAIIYDGTWNQTHSAFACYSCGATVGVTCYRGVARGTGTIVCPYGSFADAVYVFHPWCSGVAHWLTDGWHFAIADRGLPLGPWHAHVSPAGLFQAC